MASSKKQAAAQTAPIGWLAFTAWVGAVVYFVGQVDGFFNIIVAFLKACVWPAYLLYALLQSLGV